MTSGHTRLIWTGFLSAMLLPIASIAISPLLAWRDPIYIGASVAGAVAMALLLAQPLLALGKLPKLNKMRARRIHRWCGMMLVFSVVVHVVGLWITSPPDIVDALMFASPTPFSVWGVIAMWAVFATALLAVFRKKAGPWVWRFAHVGIGFAIAVFTGIHVIQIEGTMEPITKGILAVFVVGAGLWATLLVVRQWSQRRAK